LIVDPPKIKGFETHTGGGEGGREGGREGQIQEGIEGGREEKDVPAGEERSLRGGVSKRINLYIVMAETRA